MSDTYDMSLDDTVDSQPEPTLTIDELQVEVDRKLALVRSTAQEFEDVAVTTDSYAGLQYVADVLDRVLDAYREF